MFLDASPDGDLETKPTRGKGAIFDIETWHAINHAINQREAVRCRPSETIGRAISTPSPSDPTGGYPTGDYPIGLRALLLHCATKPLDLAQIGKQAQ